MEFRLSEWCHEKPKEPHSDFLIFDTKCALEVSHDRVLVKSQREWVVLSILGGRSELIKYSKYSEEVGLAKVRSMFYQFINVFIIY